MKALERLQLEKHGDMYTLMVAKGTRIITEATWVEVQDEATPTRVLVATESLQSNSTQMKVTESLQTEYLVEAVWVVVLEQVVVIPQTKAPEHLQTEECLVEVMWVEVLAVIPQTKAPERSHANGRMPSGSNVGGGLGTISGSYTTDEGPRAPTNIRMPSGSNVGGGLGSYTTDEGPRASTNRRMPSGSNVGGGLGTSGSYTTDEGPRAPTNIRMPSGSNVGGGLGSYTTDEGPRASTNRRMPSGSNVGGGLGTSSSYTTDEGPRASTNRRMPSGSNVGGGLGTSGSYTTDEGTRASTNRRMPSGSNVGGGLGTSGSYTTDEGQREPSNRRISDGSSLGGGFGTSSNCTRDEGHRQSSSFISAATHKGGNTVLTNYNSSGGPGAMKTEHNLRRRVTRLKKDQVSDTQESYSDHRRASTCLRRHGTKTTDTHNHESTVNDFSNPHDVMSSSSASGFGSTLRRREHTNNYYPASYSPDHTHTTGIGKDSGSTLQSHALPLTAGGSREKQKGKANYGKACKNTKCKG